MIRALMPPERRVLRYGVAILSVAIAAAARAGLDPALGEHLPYVTFFIAVTASAWYAGPGPALLATLLGFVVATWLFVPARLAFWGAGVLIVEDDADTRESLVAVLEGEGYAVREAEDGAEALRVLRSSAVCIVLLDIFMPTMNGWAFLDEQRRDPALAAIPVVVITADARAAENAARRGVVAAMTKPADLDRLLAVVAQPC